MERESRWGHKRPKQNSVLNIRAADKRRTTTGRVSSEHVPNAALVRTGIRLCASKIDRSVTCANMSARCMLIDGRYNI
jgi:hypothetical protein